MRRLVFKLLVKSLSSTKELLVKLLTLSVTEDKGTPGVGVKSIDIRKKVKGEGIYLGNN